MREAACVVVVREEDGLVLSVSRKDDPEALGLPGGKRDPGDRSLVVTACRELREETGFKGNLITRVMMSEADTPGYETTAFFAQLYSGRIQTKEAGVVRWVPWSDLMSKGPFQNYNRDLYTRFFAEGRPLHESRSAWKSAWIP